LVTVSVAHGLFSLVKTSTTDLEFEMPNPTLATHNLTMFDLHGSRGCSCRFMGCRPIPAQVNNLMLRAVWERLTRRVSHEPLSVATSSNALLTSRCVPIHLDTREMISNMTAELVARNECPRFGCPFVPIASPPLNYSTFHDSMCLPLSFATNGPDPKYAALTASLLNAPPVVDGEVLKASGKTVFLVANGTLHAIPNADTFEHLGLNWRRVRTISDTQLGLLAMGEDIPPCWC
jgi:hypothetical protein